MTLTRWLREKVEEEQRARDRAEGRSEGLVEGRTEGISEANQKWAHWYRRLKEAQEKNEPFHEPPPEL